MLDQEGIITRPVRHVADESAHLPDLFQRRVRASGGRTAYLEKVNGRWQPASWDSFYAKSASIASALLTMGIKQGDKACIVGSTRPEWCFCDMGGQLAGMVTIGAYPTLSPAQLSYILTHSDARVVFVDGAEEVDKLLEVRKDLDKVERVYVWNTSGIEDKVGKDEWLVPLSDALSVAPDHPAIEKRLTEVKPEDTAIIIYTSGTTGPPKGAMISHANLMAFLKAGQSISSFDEEDVTLSFLPMAHAAERIASFYSRISAGFPAAYATSIPAVLDEVKEVKPTIFGSVPRIFEKAYARMMSEVSKAPPARQAIFRWSEGIGRRVVRHWEKGEPVPILLLLQYKLVDRVVFSKIREAFGGRVRHFLTGAAPISHEILEFFWAAGFPVYEVYGMTEATVVTHANRPGQVRLGSVGRPLPGIEESLADDGEILLRGPTIFQGYYKNEEATNEAIDKDGWLHTGDIGKRDKDGFLRIVDRKKHIIITAGGKNISPANIEQEIKGQDPIISQVHVHGDRRPYLTALVTIHPIEAIDWAREQKLLQDPARVEPIVQALMSNPLSRPEGLAEVMDLVTSHPEVHKRIRTAVVKANQAVSRVEAVKKVHILDRDFSLEEDEVTPTMKVKRKNIEQKYAPVFDRIYEEKAFGLEIPQSESRPTSSLSG